MADYQFDLVSMAALKGSTAARDALLKRPFELFRFDPKTEAAAYQTGEDGKLQAAVNVSLATGRALLLTGEPGTGKTAAANWLATLLGIPLHKFQVRSDSLASDLRYYYDAVDYFRRAQIAALNRQTYHVDPGGSVTASALWDAIEHDDNFPHLLLIDEIDKAPRDFPNDLLDELERLEFHCREKRHTVKPRRPELRPIVIITSNSERRLPEPFLRRCVYHNIEMSDALLNRIVDVRLGLAKGFAASPTLRRAAINCFFSLRADFGLQKRPSIDEFWHWFGCLAEQAKADATLEGRIVTASETKTGYDQLPFVGALIKLDEDMDRLAAGV